MTTEPPRRLAHCPACGRPVGLVWARYPQRIAKLRAHYPQPYRYYENRNQPLPRNYCPGSAHTPKGTS